MKAQEILKLIAAAPLTSLINPIPEHYEPELDDRANMLALPPKKIEAQRPDPR